MLAFNFIMTAPPGTLTFTAGDDMTILRLEGVSVTGNPMYLTLLARYVSSGNWVPVVQNDNGESVLTTVNLLSNNWYMAAALGNSNPASKQVGRLVNNRASSVQKVFLNQAENWDFTNPVTLKYFATTAVAPFYFSGSVGRIDWIGEAYDSSASTTNNDYGMDWKLPCKLEFTRHSDLG
jgi:hypothetical protein